MWQIQTILRLSRRHYPQGNGDDRLYPRVSKARTTVLLFTLFAAAQVKQRKRLAGGWFPSA